MFAGIICAVARKHAFQFGLKLIFQNELQHIRSVRFGIELATISAHAAQEDRLLSIDMTIIGTKYRSLVEKGVLSPEAQKRVTKHRFHCRLRLEERMEESRYMQFLAELPVWDEESNGDYSTHCEHYYFYGATIPQDRTLTLCRFVKAETFAPRLSANLPTFWAPRDCLWTRSHLLEFVQRFNSLNRPLRLRYLKRISLGFPGAPVFACISEHRSPLLQMTAHPDAATRIRDAIGVPFRDGHLFLFTYQATEVAELHVPTSADASTHPFFYPSSTRDAYGSTCNLRTLKATVGHPPEDYGVWEVVHRVCQADVIDDYQITLVRGAIRDLPADLPEVLPVCEN